MTTVILGKTNTLDQDALRFERLPLKTTLFLNSVPKSGTHLIRNIMRMFVPADQQWEKAFIQYGNLRANLEAFSPDKPRLSWGHLLFTDDSAMPLKHARHIVLVRDPYDWVLARTRFFLSEEFQGPMNHIKNGAANVEDVMNMTIMGVHERSPSLHEVYSFNAAAWIGTHARLLRYEDLLSAVWTLETPEAEAFFMRLFADCGIDPAPEDWRERVRVGSDPKQSRTARENLTVSGDIPDVLPEAQKRLVDFAAPGLRQLLGYA